MDSLKLIFFGGFFLVFCVFCDLWGLVGLVDKLVSEDFLKESEKVFFFFFFFF